MSSRAVELSSAPVYNPAPIYNPAPLPSASNPMQQYPPANPPMQQYPPANPPMQQYPPANHPMQQYPPAVIGQGYPPPAPMAAPQQILMYAQVPQLPQSGVIVEAPSWDYGMGGIFCRCTKMMRPQGDSYSVIAPAVLEYSPFIHAEMCRRMLLPFLLNGYYQVEWPQGHGLAAFTNQQELEQVCDHCRNVTSEQFRRVIPRQTKRYKRAFHIIMVVSDVIIIIGLLIWILGAWPGFVAILIGAGLEIFNRLWVMGKCRQECLLLSSVLAQALQAEMITRPRLASMRLSVGAYGTYIRFSSPQAQLQYPSS